MVKRNFFQKIGYLFNLLISIFISLVLAGGIFTPTYANEENLSSRIINKSTHTGKILMFVAYNDVWWTEYKVTYEGLRALGYDVDVVSSGTGEAYTYGGNVDDSLSTDDPQFTNLFQSNFGVAWNNSWTAQQNIPLAGRIQDITDLSEYDALVIPGGIGATAYYYDGEYEDLATGSHVTTAAEVQAAAEKINSLINEALNSGKLVVTQCHAAPIAAFSRISGTEGSGFDTLGTSVLSGKYATGYPLGDGTVAADYLNLNVTYLADEKLVLDGPDAPNFSGNGSDQILTSRDWYAETVAYLVATTHNILTTYPTPAERTANIDVLVFGGDEPGHYAPQQPARYTDLVNLLNNGSDDLNITATGTDNVNDINLSNLQNYDVLLYFRHDAIPNISQQAIEDYVAGGGGLVGLHHAVYNHLDQKQTLIYLFGGELSSAATLNNEMWIVYAGEVNHLINVNFGNFVSTYGVHLLPGDPSSTTNYTSTLGIPNTNLDEDILHGYYHFTIPANDELYTGIQFNNGVVFGTGANQINRLFSNDRYVEDSLNPNNGQYDAWGWTKLYNAGGDTTGRIVYLQPGETADRTLADPAYIQVIKNAIVWSSLDVVTPTFSDVPFNYWSWQFIESIYDAGITGGCSTNPRNYCPNGAVTRAQMAVFLLRGINGSAYTPLAATGTIFNDVPIGSFAAAWIEAFSNVGITSGCGSGNFCPNNSVTRAQMAVFLLRAKHGSSYTPPAASGTMFNDVPSNAFAAAWIEQLATEGITGGCSGGNYCPNASVTRAQMAVFLQKTFNLPLP